MTSVFIRTVSESVSALSAAKTLLVVGSKEALAASASHISALTAHLPLAAISNGHSESASHIDADGNVFNVMALSTKKSRHFGSIRGDLLHDIVSKNAGKDKDANVVVVLDSEEQVLTAALSVARAFPLYTNKQKPAAERVINVHFKLQSAPTQPVNVAKLQTLADAVRDAGKLIDMPPNELNPTTYVEIVRAVWDSRLKAAGVTLEVIQGTELRDRGYGAIWNVGKASDNLPALVILSHTPAAAKKNVVFVGKGITFDTGGLAIKSKEGMPTMKVDMGGSAGVFQGFVSTILTAPPTNYNLHAILCIAENSIDERAFRPDDIITSYSGKTIEVNNTDAEGRLVLCDGVAHACKHLSADVIVEMATLTGAQAFATGLRHAGVLSNREDFETTVVKSGRTSGDLAYPLIWSPELIGIETLMKSEVADMKNSASNRSNAPSTGAGMFVWSHLSPEEKWVEGGEGRWAHIDMAYPVTVGARATGYGVGILSTLAGELEKEFA
ncbi:leucyl aminopeptidase [Chytriomyces confervae]|uniref:Leucyl aminopeptidase n=1 Tax=Chytriomyces confervae TaxID=246404 RepID=A0A507FP32_9FUNG|nr:putative aminopeptidase npepl1 [Chytriomyces hyalinus]TPX78191.1 leucyl aminopeptidase [Chytriomyces confervae]